MKINEKKIQQLANLAKLKFSKKEAEDMFLDFRKILDFIQKLDELNTENVKPLTHIHEESNIFRNDDVIQQKCKNLILEQSFNHNNDYIKVPKIIKKS